MYRTLPIQIKTLDEIDQEYTQLLPLDLQSPTNPMLQGQGPDELPTSEYNDNMASYRGDINDNSTDKPVSIKSRISGAIFYITLIAVVLGLYFTMGNTASKAPRNIMGFSFMRVLTRSMQNEIPQYSLVITRNVDPSTIQIGDDITYLRRDSSTVTHRVIGIQENYANTGALGFETKGTSNPNSDWEIVSAHNVIGRVIFHNLALGKAVNFVRSYAIYIAILAGLIICFIMAMRRFVSSKGKVEGYKENFELATLVQN